MTSSQQTWHGQPLQIARNHAYWLFENARPSESRLLAPKEDEHARTPAACVSLSSNYNVKEPLGVKRQPHSRTPDGSKSSIRSQRQSKRISRRLEPASPLSDRSRGRVWSRRRCEQHARMPDVSAKASPVKVCTAPKIRVKPLIAFLRDRDNQATFLPECAATLPPVKGEVAILGTVWLRTAEGTEGPNHTADLIRRAGDCGRR